MVKVSAPQLGWRKLVFGPTDDSPSLRTWLRELCAIPGVQHVLAAEKHLAIEVPVSVVAVDERLRETIALHAHGPRRALVKAAFQATPLEGALPWQQAGVEAILAAEGGLLLADEMGLGKSRTAAWAAKAMAIAVGWSRPIYIVAPLYTRAVWRRELEAAGVVRDDADFFLPDSATTWADIDGRNPRVVFVHYEIAESVRSTLVFAKRRPICCIVDEAHWIKNLRTRRAKAVRQIAASAPFRIALTGTPFDNATHELWLPLSVVTGPKSWGSFADFRRRYCGATQGPYGLVNGEAPTHLEEFRARLGTCYLRRTLADLPPGYQLPEITRRAVYAPMTDAARASHVDKVARYPVKELVDAILEGRGGRRVFQILHALRNITSATKVKTTIEVVSSLLEQGESVVVFCYRPRVADQIAQTIVRRSPHAASWSNAIHGDVPQARRDVLVEQFQAPPNPHRPRLLAATYGTLREGVTLTHARHVVLHDLDWRTSVILQAEKRLHRFGQQASVQSTWVLCEDSIDTIMAQLLVRKGDEIGDVLGIESARDALAAVGLREAAREAAFDPVEWTTKAFEHWRPT